MKYSSEVELKKARTKAIRNAKEEGQSGARAGRMFDFLQAMEQAACKKAGTILDVKSSNIRDKELDFYGTATLLVDCEDGGDGIYLTDKGAFFARNFTRVVPSHPMYKRAEEKGYITPEVLKSIGEIAPINRMIGAKQYDWQLNGKTQTTYTGSLVKLMEDCIGYDYNKNEVDIYEKGEELLLLRDSRDFDKT